jgi:colicin import membrane protein
MATHCVETNESSVVFNLRQLMQLEHERVLSDEASACAARVAAQRARAQRQHDAEQHAERIATERQAALLRVRLQAEASTRAESERIALEHVRQLQRMQHEAARSRLTRALLGAAAILIGASIAHATLADTQRQPAPAAVSREAQTEAVAARPRSEPRQNFTAEAASSVPTLAVSQAVPQPQPTAASSVHHRARAAHESKRQPRPARTEASASGAAGLDEMNNDPLFGLDEPALRKP